MTLSMTVFVPLSLPILRAKLEGLSDAEVV